MSQTEVLTSTKSAPRFPSIRLDPSLYNPSREEIEFFKSQTKIENEDELKEHIVTVQREAWDVVNYKCIRNFGFMKDLTKVYDRLRISRHPAYQDLLKLGRDRSDAIFIDYACCFGNDARKAVADGYPIENVVTSDLQQGKPFWELGHRLFKSTPETFPVPFIQGSVFDPNHIEPAPPHYTPPRMPRPDLSTLKSLTPLQGHVSAIHVSAFFHLFEKEEQVKAARALASLLSPVPGSMIFGMHSTMAESKGITHPDSNGGFNVYNFSPEDWCKLWDGDIFRKGSVTVETELMERTPSDGDGPPVDRRRMVWCVKRV